MRSFIASAVTAAALVSTVAADTIPSIVIKGSKFFYENNGTQFFMKGVAYQQEYTASDGGSSSDAYKDPLADSASCLRDIPYFQQLQTNTIRVYAVNPAQNHDECMNALAAAGIYVVADLSAPVEGASINRNSPSWNDQTYDRYISVVDALAGYPNTLGFFAGNEVSNQANNTDASAFVKAAVRDTKAYIKAKGYRTIGVGYATNDDAEIRVKMADYFNCGDQSAAIDFWGYNIYSWCGDSSFTESGYDVRTKEFSTYSVPVFFAEYGCNEVQPRTFTEVGTLFGPQMTGVWSGGIVYMYFQEANNYGLVDVSGNTVTPRQDFTNLASQIAKVSPSGVNSASYSPTNSPVACPATGSDWTPVASPLPPSPNQELCSCMYNSLSCVPSNNVDSDSYGDLFGTVCGYGKNVCAGISANASTGTYGAYGMCNATEQLGFALNSYYTSQGKKADACAFGGSASLRNAAATPAGTCASLVSQAGTNGLGHVTASPVAGGSDAKASGSHSPGAGVSTYGAPSMVAGFLPMALLTAVGFFSGMGMLVL